MRPGFHVFRASSGATRWQTQRHSSVPDGRDDTLQVLPLSANRRPGPMPGPRSDRCCRESSSHDLQSVLHWVTPARLVTSPCPPKTVMTRARATAQRGSDQLTTSMIRTRRAPTGTNAMLRIGNAKANGLSSGPDRTEIGGASAARTSAGDRNHAESLTPREGRHAPPGAEALSGGRSAGGRG